MSVILHAGLTRDWLERVEASAITETSETDKKKRKKKRKGSKLSNEQANSDKSSETLVTSKDNEPLRTDTDGPSKTGNDGGSTGGGKATPKKTESSETSKTDSDVSDKGREASNDSGRSSERAKLSKTGKDCPKEQCAESAAGRPPLKTSDSLKALSESKGTSAMKQKTVKKSTSKESGGEEEVEPVAKEVGEVAKDVSTGGDGGAAAAAARKKLHTCGLCGREEVTAKTFKRCQK